MIGTSIRGNSITNVAPLAMAMTLTVNVTGIQPGSSYNLYRYQYAARSDTAGRAGLGFKV